MTPRRQTITVALLLLLTACAHREAAKPAEAPPPPPPPPAAEPAPAPAPAAENTPPPAPENPPVDLPHLMKAGITFVDQMSDTNASDTYVIHVDSVRHGLTWTWKMGESNDADHGKEKTPEGTLKKSSTIAFISQGHPSPAGHRTARATPPFLLSRADAKELAAGKTVKISIFDVKNAKLKKDDTETKTIDVDGSAASVSTIRATDGSTSIWFVNDPKWPILVAATFEGDNGIELKEVRTK